MPPDSPDDTTTPPAPFAEAAPESAATLILAALGQLAEGVVLTDAGGRIIFVNDAAARLHGMARLDVAPEQYADTYHLLTEDGQPYPSTELPLARAAIRGETVVDARWRIRRPDGTEILAVGNATPVLDASGRQLGAVLTLRDDTARHAAVTELELANHRLQDQAVELEMQTEELQAATEQLGERTAAAEAAEEQLQAAFAQAPVAVAVTRGPEHRFVLANPGYWRLVGRAVYVGQTFAEALPEISNQGYTALLDRVFTTGVAYAAHESHAWVQKDGPGPEEGWYDFVYQPLVDAAGRVTGIMQLGIEVSDQVRARHGVEALNAELRAANEALVTSEAKYRALFESIDAGFCVIEMLFDDAGEPVDYRFIETNPAFVAQTGLANAIGRTARELVPELERHWVESYGRVAITGTAERFENGSEPMGRWFDVFAFRAGRPEERRVAVLFTDVTVARRATVERERLLGELHAANEELRTASARLVERTAAAEDARRAAEAANRAKSDFLAVMSHELRTPLNAIGGYTELLELGIHGPVTQEQRTALERIQRSQRVLLAVINEVLNYARLESGAVTYDLAGVPVAEAIGAAELFVAPQLRAKGLGYTWTRCDPQLAVRADRDKLQQVLLNVLSNAVKFTNVRPGLAGRIDVSCEVQDGVADRGRILIHVQDTGVGIPADKLDAVFEPFVQVGRTFNNPGEGTGLGLAISRDLARGMGGDLTVVSEPGVGSTFTLTLLRA